MLEVTIMISEDVDLSEDSSIIRVDGRYTGYGINSDPELLVRKASDMLSAAEFLRNKREGDKEQQIRKKMVELFIIFYNCQSDQDSIRRFKLQITDDPAMVQGWYRLAEAVMAAEDADQEQA